MAALYRVACDYVLHRNAVFNKLGINFLVKGQCRSINTDEEDSYVYSCPFQIVIYQR